MHLCIEVYLVFCNNESIKKHKMQSISVVIKLNEYNNALYIHILMYLCVDLKKRTVVRDKKLPKKGQPLRLFCERNYGQSYTFWHNI